MTFSTRTLMATFAISVVVMIWLQAIIGLHGLASVDDEVRGSASAAVALRLGMDADMMHEGVEAQVYRAVMQAREGRVSEWEGAVKELDQLTARLDKDLLAVRAQPLPHDTQQLLEAALPVARAYTSDAREVAQLAGHNVAQAQARLASFQQHFADLERSLDALGGALEGLSQSAREHSAETVASVRQRVLLISLVVTALTCTGLGLFARFLWQTLGGEPRQAVAMARAIAEGDLSVELTSGEPQRHSVLGEMGWMVHQLRQLVDDVRSQAEEVSSASSQIAQGNMDLSERTEVQASSLQQTSASMQDLGGTLHKTSSDARQAMQVARHACDVAHRGGSAMSDVVQTMQGIRDSAHRIADIISVIDGIAFQTNILALNAAVEAARAGEQGKGFAVVASEVRSLAQHTSQAAREIKTLIGDSVGRVAVGAEQVESARLTMHDIVDCIGQVNGIVERITLASERQSTGLGEAAQAVHAMDVTTQQNATLVEQTAAAAEGLRTQAYRLVQVVSRFRLTAT